MFSGQVRKDVARSLPSRVIRESGVLPFKVERGHLFLAAPELPSEDVQQTLRRFTSLELRFNLITTANFAELTRDLL